MKPAILIDGISKAYAGKQPVTALDNISLCINEGELFGLIGPDGAGKTSLFRILTTLLLADSGSATVNGLDVVEDPRPNRIHARQILALSRLDSGRKPALFCRCVQHHDRGQLPADRGHLRADRTLQEEAGWQVVGWNEAKIGSLLCIDSQADHPFFGRANHWRGSCFPERILGNAA